MNFIAIVGEDWNHILGNENTKYLSPKIGLIVHGNGGGEPLSDTLRNMQIISGNADLALHPLGLITATVAEQIEKFAKNNPRYREASLLIHAAVKLIRQTEEAYSRARHAV